MLKMPTIHTPPPIQPLGSWQNNNMQLNTLAQQNATTSAAPVQRPSWLGSLTYSLVLTSFLALSGCDYVDRLLGRNKTDPAPMAPGEFDPKAIPESAFAIGKSRKVRRRPKGKYAKRLERQAYNRAMKKLRRETRRIVGEKFPVDCQHASKYSQEIDWVHSRSKLMRDARGRYYYRYQLLWRSATCMVFKPVTRGRKVKLSFTANNPILR